MMIMAAVAGVHSADVELAVTVGSQGHNGVCELKMRANFNVLPGSDLPRVVEVKMSFPNNQAATIAGTIYNLAWQLDHAIGKAYEQMSLKEV